MGSREVQSKPPNGTLTFTLFIILPTDDVCSLRNLASGVTVRELRCRLELMAGIPSQIYRLVCSDDVALHEEHQLVLEKNVWDGFIIRIQLYDSWTKLFKAVLADDGDYVINHGAVHFQSQKVATPEDETKFKDITRERAQVALFMASYFGHVKLCQRLISLGIDVNAKTPFRRTPLHAAVSRDHERVFDILIKNGASTDSKDVIGDSVEIVARKCFSKQCVRKLRIMKLQSSPPNGVTLDGSANRRITIPLNPTPPSIQPSKQQTSAKARLAKRHTVASVASKSVSENGTRDISQSQQFMWDTDNPASRSASAARFRGGNRNTEMPRIGTANSRPGVTWDDSTPRTPSRHTPVIPSLNTKQSILKNRASSCGTIPSRSPASRDSGRQCLQHQPTPPQSEHGSQMSIASAPGIGPDTSRGDNYDARSVESAPELPPSSVGATAAGDRPGTCRKEFPKRPRTRLLVSRHRTNESWRTMKRRIQMAEHKKKVTEEDKQRKRETFEEWLHRKRKQEKRDSRESDSDESGQESDDGSNTEAFKEWLKEQRERRILRPQTVTVADLYRRQTRPLKGLVTVTDPTEVDIDGNDNMVAHKKWREKYNDGGEHAQTRDIDNQKKRLEEKRQSLLARAVSYDEWMEHTEDRKALMQQILRANMIELERIETEKLKQRAPRQVSYSQWREKVEKQESIYRKRSERMRARREEETKMRIESRNSASVSHDVWARKKDEEKRLRQEREKENSRKVKVRSGDNSEAFDVWLEKKHEQDLVEIKAEIRKERDMIRVLRDRRMASVTTC